MPLFDLPLTELQQYRYPRTPPADLREFWDTTLAESRAAAGEPVITPARHRMTAFDASDLTYTGFGGEPVKAWWLRPAGWDSSPRPAVIEYLGYGGGRGLVHERLLWPAHGYHYVVVDTRGQGSLWNTGDTPDPHGSAPAADGYLTRGLDHPANLYYRRLYTDAALAIDAVAALPSVDPNRVAVVGHSQGGAMTLAAAALNQRAACAAARAPFMCGIDRNLEITAAEPYAQLGRYLSVHRDAAALDVLAYVDCALLTPWIDCPVTVSVALQDVTCPPSGIYGAVNNLPNPANVIVWPYNGHEAGRAFEDQQWVEWVGGQLGNDEKNRGPA